MWMADGSTSSGILPAAAGVATVVVACSAGTYVRSLAADLGSALRGCAHLDRLRRLAVGSFGLDEARPLDAVEREPDAAVLEPAAAMRDPVRGFPPGPGQPGTGAQAFSRTGAQGVADTRQQERYDVPDYGQDEPDGRAGRGAKACSAISCLPGQRD